MTIVKTCIECGADFDAPFKGHGTMVRCRPCQVALKRSRQSAIMRSIEGRFYHAKYNAAERGHAWLLSIKEYAALIGNGVICSYCGNGLNQTGSGLDRLDDAKPYVIDNVVPSCWPCNYLRMRGAFESRRDANPRPSPRSNLEGASAQWHSPADGRK